MKYNLSDGGSAGIRTAIAALERIVVRYAGPHEVPLTPTVIITASSEICATADLSCGLSTVLRIGYNFTFSSCFVKSCWGSGFIGRDLIESGSSGLLSSWLAFLCYAVVRCHWWSVQVKPQSLQKLGGVCKFIGCKACARCVLLSPSLFKY